MESALSRPLPRTQAWPLRMMAAYTYAAGWWRLSRFLSVGALCFGIQFALVHILYASGLRPGWLCDAYGFFVSTQVNAVLTMVFTFKHKPGWRKFAFGWLLYNGVALGSLGLNATVFAVVHPLAMRWFAGLPFLGQPTVILLAATAAGAAVGWMWSFRVCRRVFAPRLDDGGLVIQFEGLTAREAGSLPGAAVVMPAYKENQNPERPNLWVTTTGVLATFDAAGIPCTVGICADGGPDGTPELASRLVREHPGRVVVAHHRDRHGRPNNRGYGRAVKTALGLGVTTGREYVVAVDSDPQFRPSDLVAAYRYGLEQRAEAVLGYRRRRQDGRIRGATGKLWTFGSNLWIRPPRWVRDGDCAVKVFWARSLMQFKLVGQYGMMGAELVAWCKALKLHTVQFSVEHVAREDNHNQTGLNRRVVFGTFANLPAVYWNLVKERKRWRLTQRLVRPKDMPTYLVTLAAALLSMTAFAVYFRQGVTIDYPDAAAHLEIADRVWVFHSAAQLGVVWLPLMHLLDLWGVWSPKLYYSGIAGSAISMIAFVITVRYLFKLGRLVSGGVLGGGIAATVLLTNSNLLFMQSTPMTESVMFATVAVGVYFLTMWARTDNWRHLAISSFAIMLGCANRYEDWWFALTMGLAAGYIAWRKRGRSWAKLMLIAFGSVTGIVVVGWMLWGLLILHSPLYFLNGAFAKPSLWVKSHEPAIHHWPIAALTYWYAMTDNLGLPVILAAIVGVILYVVRTRLRPEALPPLILGTYIPFFIEQLESGERPLHVMQINGSLYNTRFALGMSLGAALFIGYLATQLTRLPWPAVRGVAAAGTLAVVPALVLGLAFGGPPVSLKEAISFRTNPQQTADAHTASWLRLHYGGGLVLMEGFDNVTVLFDSRIPTAKVVYEGSNRHNLWRTALRYPTQSHIRVIVMRVAPTPDKVWTALHNAAELRHDYHLAHRGANELVYLRGPAPPRLDKKVAASTPAMARMNPQVSAGAARRHQSPGPHAPAHRVRHRRAGLAAWYPGQSGYCIAGGYRLGVLLRVQRQHPRAQVVCRVIANPPNLRNRVLTLARSDFAAVAPLADGLVSVYVVPTNKGRR